MMIDVELAAAASGHDQATGELACAGAEGLGTDVKSLIRRGEHLLLG